MTTKYAQGTDIAKKPCGDAAYMGCHDEVGGSNKAGEDTAAEVVMGLAS